MPIVSDATRYRWRTRLARRVHRLGDAVAPPPPPDQLRRRVGGNWEVIGKLQFDYLVSEGMRPEHRLIDVGCGTLRGGVHYVGYLDSGNYFGIDLGPEMIEGGRGELARAGLDTKTVHLRATDTFDVDFGVPFDYGMALSVFTHVSLNSITLCLSNLSSALAVGGRFYGTYFRGPASPERTTPIAQPFHPGFSQVTTYCDRNPFHYTFDDLRHAAADLPLQLDDVGDWGHPRGQQMLRVTRTA